MIKKENKHRTICVGQSKIGFHTVERINRLKTSNYVVVIDKRRTPIKQNRIDSGIVEQKTV